MTWAAVRHHLWPPPDPRSESQIDADIDDELAFHLEMLERELIESGLDEKDAKLEALRRFGNVAAIRNQCRRIALKERIMLQRINLVLMIIVLIAVAVVGVQVMVTQRYNTLALQDITAQIAQMRFAEKAAAVGEQSEPQARVLIEGDIANPGWYPITLEPATYLQDVLVRVNATPDQWVRYSNNSPRPVEHFLSAESERIVLRPDDELRVSNTADTNAKASYAVDYRLRGSWRQVDTDGATIADAYTIRFNHFKGSRNALGEFGPPENHNNLNLQLSRFGTLEYWLPQQKDDSSEESTDATRLIESTRPVRGRWHMEDELLVLQLDEPRRGLPESMRFVRVDDGDAQIESGAERR